MKRPILLFALFLSLFLLGMLATAGLVLAQPGAYSDLGIQPGPNGSSLHWYSVSVPDECYGAMTTQQADGSLSTQYFKTKADYDAALAALAKPSGGKGLEGTKTTDAGGSAQAVSPASSTSRTCVQGLWWAGYRWNSLTTTLTWTYDGTNVTSRSRTASSGIRSPWTWYGSSSTTWTPSSLPAANTLLDVFQAYADVEIGVTYYNVLRNKTRAYGNGSSSWSESVFGIDSRLSGWTRTIGDS